MNNLELENLIDSGLNNYTAYLNADLEEKRKENFDRERMQDRRLRLVRSKLPNLLHPYVLAGTHYDKKELGIEVAIVLKDCAPILVDLVPDGSAQGDYGIDFRLPFFVHTTKKRKRKIVWLSAKNITGSEASLDLVLGYAKFHHKQYLALSHKQASSRELI